MREEIKQDWPCRFTDGIPREECPIHNSDDTCSIDGLPCDCQEYVPAVALAALRAKNAELEAQVKELEEENQKGKDLLIWARDVFDNENKLAEEIISYLNTKTPPPAEPEEDV